MKHFKYNRKIVTGARCFLCIVKQKQNKTFYITIAKSLFLQDKKKNLKFYFEKIKSIFNKEM